MNKKCITTVFTFLFFYVTVALVYAKSGHMYHKNLITFYSYMASFFSGDFYFLHAYAIIIPFVYLVYLPRMMAPQTSCFVCRYQTRYQYFRCQYQTVLCFTLLFAALHILSGGIYLFTQIGFRYLSCSSVLFIFLFQWIADFLYCMGIFCIQQILNNYVPTLYAWSMSFMLHADFSLQNKQQFFPSSSELSGSHSLYGAPPVCDCMLL